MEVTRSIGKVSATLLADFILLKYGPMSHLKLQKLLYYTDAYHLAYFETELIAENFEAWVHGPVCKEVYEALKDRSKLYSEIGFNGSYNPEELIVKSITEDQLDLISQVNNELATWSAIDLESATHSETPWLEARMGLNPAAKSNNIISKQTMREFYTKELYGKVQLQ